ncbi:MAG: UDP-N-acetylmuramoyl-tripeptide--D-alanyl-D-alanine ligase [Janthinobacterium lividum]
MWTSDAIALATGGVASASFIVDDVTFDSREVAGGELFVALAGAASDGHAFLGEAVQRGAAGLLVSQTANTPNVRVADTMAGLTALATAARARATTATIVGVTGSVGKTGVKEALRLALERSAPGHVHASVKSYNNHTGVPLSLARMPAHARFGVYEMGMNHAGELANLTRLVRPDVAVITAIASAHLEFFGGEEAIADAKSEIFEGLEPGGVAVIPFDTPHRDRLIDHARGHAARIVTFGIREGADVRATTYKLHADCSCASAMICGERLMFKIAMAGAHWLSNGLAVLAAVQAAGGDIALAGLALAELPGLPGRGARFGVRRNGGEATILDESYNANPASMAASLNVLRTIIPAGSGRRMAVLGEMRELGTLSEALHVALAPAIFDAGIKRAILVGEAMRPLADALGKRVTTSVVANAGDALALVEHELVADDVVLIKGSNGVRLGEVVASLRKADRR